MKFRYTFPVSGRVRLVNSPPIPSSGLVYHFFLGENQVITHLTVTSDLPDPKTWPRFEDTGRTDIKFQIINLWPRLEEVRRRVRLIESLLSLYGILEIDTSEPKVEWLPESPDEENALEAREWRMSRDRVPTEQLPYCQEAFIGQSILRADSCTSAETPLNFYRKGCVDVADNRFIDAIYDFYFMIETLFAQGKHRTRDVKQAFKESAMLMNAIGDFLSEGSLEFSFDKKEQREFDRLFSGASPEEIVDEIVDLRGQLHHHALKRKEVWHPAEEERFRFQALCLQHITLKLGFLLVGDSVYSHNAAKQFEDVVNKQAPPRGETSI